MKTRHIVAIGILTAVAVGLLAIGIKTKSIKGKILETKAVAENYKLTNLNNQIYEKNGTRWTFDYRILNEIEPNGNTIKNTLKVNFTLKSVVNTYGQFTTQNEYTYTKVLTSTTGVGQFQMTLLNADVANYNPFSYKGNYRLSVRFTINNQADNNTYTYRDVTINTDQFATSLNQTSINTSKVINYNYFTSQELDLYNYAYEVGYNNGNEIGETTGYETGYNEGYFEGAEAQGEAMGQIDIRGLILNILTMPFTFISQAFDVTLWEGTPYAFNISNFIKGMIAIATILFIINLFIHGFSAIGNYTGSATNRNLKRSQIKLNKAKTRRENNLADKGK